MKTTDPDYLAHLNKRERIAIGILCGMIYDDGWCDADIEFTAGVAVKCADALIKELNKESEDKNETE